MYNKIGWINDEPPAINQDNLNHMDQGIYDAHQVITELTLNDLNQFTKIKDYTITDNSYVEALAYGNGYIYAGARNHNDNDSTTIYLINESTLEIDNSFTIPIGIINAMEYYDNFLYATMVTDALGIYKISLSDYSYSVYKTFSPDSELYLNYDAATGKFIISQHDYTDGTKTLIIKIYNSLSDATPERTIIVPLAYWDKGENIQQDRCVYNNLLYEGNWYGLTIIDIEKGEVIKRFGTKNDVEPEGICRIGDKCYFSIHNVGQNGHEFLFKLNNYSDLRNGLGTMCEIQGYELTDVNFNYVRGAGVYPFSYSSQSAAQSCGMPALAGMNPTYPTTGILKVETSPKESVSFEPQYIIQTVYDTNNEREFVRYSNNGGTTFSSYKEDVLDYCKGLIASDIESTYFGTTHSVLVRKFGVFLIVMGFFSGSDALPTTRLKLCTLPAGSIQRTIVVPAILMEGGTYNGTKISATVAFSDDQSIYLYPTNVSGKSGYLQFTAVIF